VQNFNELLIYSCWSCHMSWRGGELLVAESNDNFTLHEILSSQ